MLFPSNTFLLTVLFHSWKLSVTLHKKKLMKHLFQIPHDFTCERRFPPLFPSSQGEVQLADSPSPSEEKGNRRSLPVRHEKNEEKNKKIECDTKCQNKCGCETSTEMTCDVRMLSAILLQEEIKHFSLSRVRKISTPGWTCIAVKVKRLQGSL